MGGADGLVLGPAVVFVIETLDPPVVVRLYTSISIRQASPYSDVEFTPSEFEQIVP